MTSLFLVIGTLILLAFLLSRRTIFTVVTSTIGKGDFCPQDFLPPSVGIAPEWKGSDLSKVIFFIDPTTGCIFERRGTRSLNVIVLSDRAQIARFIQLNGLPPKTTRSEDIFQTPSTPLEVCSKVEFGGLGFACKVGQTQCIDSTGKITCR